MTLDARADADRLVAGRPVAGLRASELLPGSDILDRRAYERTVRLLRDRAIRLPTFAELATGQPDAPGHLATVDPDAPDPDNLGRIHWYNGRSRRDRIPVPAHVVLPKQMTGVDAPIVVLLGALFPMIHSHKLLAAYACLVPRLATGRFDPTTQRAVWPSTGNYCRGGVALSRVLGCRGVAVLPEGMSEERFRWLEAWVTDPADIVRTPGSESNVREIYERCEELARDPANVVLNQFAEFGNHVVHRVVTGRAIEHAFEAFAERRPSARLAAFVAASGSAGTLGAGDYLKERHGTRIAVAEAVECPTLLRNGFGEHNIQGIGDKHVPLIHNVLNTDFVVGVSDRATDQLSVLANSTAGRAWLADEAGVPDDVIATLELFGLSSLCNVVAAIKTAKHYRLGEDDVIATVATDGAAMYRSEHAKVLRRDFGGEFTDRDASRVFGQHLLGVDDADTLELTLAERTRIFNLGYFTWVEQRGVSIEAFSERARPAFWQDLASLSGEWDEAIGRLNEDVALGATR
ncbi:MAG TPA: pyridoxal-phosphate dependent enzyme [Candidatus Binatia bacterium]|nr:pyridoxal-phosphate dependent enzyme [Candidatus Binatia bacterium]